MEKIFGEARFERAASTFGLLDFHLLLSVEMSGSLYTRWHGIARQKVAHFISGKRCWVTVGKEVELQRAPDSAASRRHLLSCVLLAGRGGWCRPIE